MCLLLHVCVWVSSCKDALNSLFCTCTTMCIIEHVFSTCGGQAELLVAVVLAVVLAVAQEAAVHTAAVPTLEARLRAHQGVTCWDGGQRSTVGSGRVTQKDFSGQSNSVGEAAGYL